MENRLKKTDKEVNEIKKILIEHLNGTDRRALELKAHIAKTIDDSMSLYVNGKLDKVHNMLKKQNERSDAFEKKVDAHIAEVEPFIQAKAGLGVLFKWLVGLAATLLAWAQIRGYWKL